MHQTWLQIRSLLETRSCLSLFDLNPPASADAIRSLERHIRLSLPQSFKELLALHNGQGPGRKCGLFFGDEFLSITEIQTQWDNWKSLEDENLNEELASSMSSQPPGVVKPHYLNSRWVPFTHDGGGNHSALDFDPDSEGHIGQVIAFGRDEDEKKLLGSSFEDFLSQFQRRLLSVRWSLVEGYWKFEEPQYRCHYHAWPVL
ncbi:SMI1/KNR4 family protein [Cupriavidus necator]|uniref:SMI1/KNR4 family protein n=1 Tax=Cupriavidus necator TaxID=106590 RepID=UPI0011D24873|nr:SMI1/KNR4 family protein [Cupriavidus necator]MDX6007970.1 SMI1/KNR4 family protein [Cupriavidus necator]